MSSRFLFIRIFVFILYSLPLFAFGQGNLPILIDDTKNIEDVIKALQGPGTEITNITYSMPGQTKAIGYFEDTDGLLGLKKGLIITTEAARFATGPNNGGGSVYGKIANEMNDADLVTITTGPFFDIAIVEFDVKTLYPQFSFSYVFGSEEYTEFVNTGFNDTFGFFISGPGINGTKNLAELDNGSPISINSINNIVNSEYFVSNGDGTTPNVNYYLQYDGLTKKLVATTKVIPGETYHIKIIISDVGDNNFDSGVFIEQESFVSEIPYDVKVSYEHTRFDHSIEGCNKAYFTIQREAQDAVAPLVLDVSFAGAAANGIDFIFVQPGTLTLAPGELTSVIEINALADALPEGDESVIVHVTNTVTGKLVTTQLVIRDEMEYSINESTICATNPTAINTNPEIDFSFNWEQHTGLSCQQCSTPTATLAQNTVFQVEVTYLPSGCQTNTTASVLVNNFEYHFSDEAICFNAATAINKSGSDSYVYRWADNQGLSCLNCVSPSITILQKTNLSVEVEEVASGCKTNSEMHLNVNNFSFTFEEASVCKSMPGVINKNPLPGYAFTWQPYPSLSCTSCASPSINVSQNTRLSVEVEEIASGCKTNSELLLNIYNVSFTFEESSVCENMPTAINKNPSPGYAFIWQPHPSLSCTNCTSPSVILNSDVSFQTTVKELATGCEIKMEVPVKVRKMDYKLPDSFVCKDEENAINVDASEDYTYRWKTNPVISCTDCKSPRVKLDRLTSFPVEVEEIKTGCRKELQALVKINTVNYIIPPMTACENTSTIINSNAPGQYLFQWKPETRLSCLSCSSPFIKTDTDLQLSAQVEDTRIGCHTTLTVPVKVIRVDYPVHPEEVCQNTQSGIHTNFPQGYSFQWLPDEDLSCLNCSSPTVLLQNDKSFKLEVTENKSACKTNVTIPVRVKKIAAQFTYTITDQYSSIVSDFKNLSEGANEYRWDFGDGNNSSAFEPKHQYDPMGETITVQLTAVNNKGLYCEAISSTTLFIHESIFIPNVITPDNDAYNQSFVIKGIEKGVWLLTILNSWGNRVYTSNGYQNNWEAENLSSGIYYYELRNPYDNTSYKGWLHVIR